MNINHVASLVKRKIGRYGSTVTLPSGATRKALFITDPKQLQKFTKNDGELLDRGKLEAVFVFVGTDFGAISEGDMLTIHGMKYIVDPPLHPEFVGDVCVEFAVACYKFAG